MKISRDGVCFIFQMWHFRSEMPLLKNKLVSTPVKILQQTQKTLKKIQIHFPKIHNCIFTNVHSILSYFEFLGFGLQFLQKYHGSRFVSFLKCGFLGQRCQIQKNTSPPPPYNFNFHQEKKHPK